MIWLFLVPSGASVQQKSLCQVEFGRLNTALRLLDLRGRVFSNCANHAEASGSHCFTVFGCLRCAQRALISHHFLWDSASKTSDCELHASACSSWYYCCSVDRADRVEFRCQCEDAAPGAVA